MTLGNDCSRYHHIVVGLERRATVAGRPTINSQELLRIPRSSLQPIATEIPFPIETATEPPTYHGTSLQIEHAVVARAELDDGRALEARTSVVIRSAGVTASASEDDDLATRRGCGRLVGIALILYGITLSVASLGDVETTLAGAVGAVIGIALLAGDFRRRRWGRVAVKLNPDRVAPGAEMVVRAELEPRRERILQRVEATLEAEEIVEVPDPDGHTTHHERVVELRQTVFDGNRKLAPGSRFALTATVVIPSSAQPTFRCSAGRLHWRMRLRLEGNRGVWEDVFPITVVGVRDSDQARTAG